MADLFAMLLDELRLGIAGEENQQTLRALALLGVRYLARHEYLRCLLVGDAGSGKTSAVTHLAECLDATFLRVCVPEMPETTWSGGADLLDRIRGAKTDATGDASRMILLLDDLDCVQLKPWEAYAPPDRNQREGRQRSLLSVWSGDSVATGDEYVVSFETRRFFVIGCLQGADLPERVGAPDLLKWGFIPALADRFAMSPVLRMHPAVGATLVAVATREAERLVRPAYEAFGYQVSISSAAARYALQVTSSSTESTRALIGLLRDAADRALIELVAAGAETGTARTIRPDDLPLR